jgi:hypothetical protein
MSSDLPDRIRDAAATPSRHFDLVGARRRVHRRRLVAGGSSAVLALTAVVAVGVGLGNGPASGPFIEDRLAPSGSGPTTQPSDDCAAARQAADEAIGEGTLRDGEIRRLQDEAMLACDPPPEQDTPPPPERCSNAPQLPSLEAATEVADEVALFAACPTADHEVGTLTRPYFALGRELARDEATPADLLALYIEGLTPAEADDGYVLTRSDLTEGAITAAQHEGTVTVSFTSEALIRNNFNTTSASTALLEEFGALFLQLSNVETVRFTLEGSCEDFATALERGGPCVEVDREQVGAP